MLQIISFKQKIIKQNNIVFTFCTVFIFSILFVSTCFAQIQEQDQPVCGNNAEGFHKWKIAISKRAAKKHVGKAGLAALIGTRYADKTITADRNQQIFKLSLKDFMRKRNAEAVIKHGKVIKQQKAALFENIEKQFGVSPGPLLAIWGMESNFGRYMGEQNTISALATLAYDCRRTEFFTKQLYAALQLIDKGELKPQSIGAMHGEIGHTQFLPLNILRFGVDGDKDGKVDLTGSVTDALVSTANFLRSHGWQKGTGYQPGESNFVILEKWNKAKVYQRAIAAIGQKIDS